VRVEVKKRATSDATYPVRFIVEHAPSSFCRYSSPLPSLSILKKTTLAPKAMMSESSVMTAAT
jgi:hypothetical protein